MVFIARCAPHCIIQLVPTRHGPSPPATEVTQRCATRSYTRATDTMSLVTAMCPDLFSQLSYQANPQGRVAAFLQAHHHVWVSRAPGRAFTYWRLSTSISNHWKHWAQLGAISRWLSSVLSQRVLPHTPPVSALTAAMDRISTPPVSPTSSISPGQPDHHEDTVAASLL